MFEMTNYTRYVLGGRLHRFGYLFPLANRPALPSDSDQSEQFFASTPMFRCKLMRIQTEDTRITGKTEVAPRCQKLAVFSIQVANGGRESSLNS